MFNPEDFKHQKEFVLAQDPEEKFAKELSQHLPLVLEKLEGYEGLYYGVGNNGTFVITVSSVHSSDEGYLDFCIAEMSEEVFRKHVEEQTSWGESWKLPIITGNMAYSILRELQYADLV